MKFLKSEVVQDDNHPYKNYTPQDWALAYILRYGGIDGSHHKDWVMDQVIRVLNGTNVIIEASHFEKDNGEIKIEYYFTTGEASEQYHKWVYESCLDENGEIAWTHNVGIAP